MNLTLAKIWSGYTRISLQGWKKELGKPETQILKSRNFLTELRKQCKTIPITSIHFRDSDYYYTDIEWYENVFKTMFWKAGIKGYDKIKYIPEKRDCDAFAIMTVAMFEFLEVNAMWRVSGYLKWKEGGKFKTESHAFNLFYAIEKGVKKFYVYDSMFNLYSELKQDKNGWIWYNERNLWCKPTAVIE